MASQESLIEFGFKLSQGGAHASRTMMLAELELLFSALPENASQDEYKQAIELHNVLNKSTNKTRSLTFRHLVDLYSLDPSYPLFRVFRRLWAADEEARPVLTCHMATARDPLLRLSQDKILNLAINEELPRVDMEQVFEQAYPERFSPATLKSLAQNINATWTHAGFLSGRAKKIRQEPEIKSTNVTFALFLGYLQGATGNRLFTTEWVKILNLRTETLIELARQASHKGLLTFKHSSEIIEILFPGYLTAEEEAKRHE